MAITLRHLKTAPVGDIPWKVTYVVIGIIGYLIGSFPTGVVITRRRFGIDVRDMGSGNIGATNVTRVFGWFAGVMTFVLDYAKGTVPVWWVSQLFPGEGWLLTTAGVSLVVGHCFSAFLKLRGGKGVATSLGVITAVDPWVSLAAAGAYLLLLVITRISAVGSLAGAAVCLGYVSIFKPEQSVRVLLLSLVALIIVRHKDNIRRLWQGMGKKT